MRSQCVFAAVALTVSLMTGANGEVRAGTVATLSLESVTVPFGADVEVGIQLTHEGPGEVEAIWMGICWIWPDLLFLEMTLGPGLSQLAGGAGPDLFVVDDDPIGGSGVTCGTILSFSSTVTLPPGFDDEILRMHYQYVAAIGTSQVVLFPCDTLGSPPLATHLVVDGVEVVPEQVPGVLFLEASPPVLFRRGDADADGILAISDPLVILAFLFQDGTLSCRAAADMNDDGLLGLDDAIGLLSYLFISGPPPPDPHGFCGDDAVTPLDCASYPSC